MKMQNGTNFARSAKAPVISAGVMMANMSWNTMNSSCGMPGPACESPIAPTPFSPKWSRLPMRPQPSTSGPKASE